MQLLLSMESIYSTNYSCSRHQHTLMLREAMKICLRIYHNPETIPISKNHVLCCVLPPPLLLPKSPLTHSIVPTTTTTTNY